MGLSGHSIKGSLESPIHAIIHFERNTYRMNGFRTIVVAVAAALLTCFANEAWCRESPIQFNRDVLPILAENCFACHGFDSNAREADLRLDGLEWATEDRGGYRVIAPGDPESSELVARITTDDADLVMPPPDSGKTLSADDRKMLRQWILQGAEYESHWAFIAPGPVTTPDVPSSSHPVDSFIRERLAEAGLTPAPLADPVTLIRRVSLDLIGLPPTVEEIEAFELDWRVDSERAWIELVDRLLRSPHYGERWGRWWLDQARYADSNGYSIDSPRSIWKYRDWVIEALNADLPFDQFTIEQLAGDLLPGATTSQRVATGFHRNTQINQEGGIDREQFRIDSVFDRVATTGTVWLGLTIGCAQCHDHKFDPISQREFYQLFAFFNNQDEPTIKVYPEELDIDAINAEKREFEKQLEAMLEEWSETQANWETSLSDEDREQLSSNVRKALATGDDKRSFSQRLDLFASGPKGGDESFRSLLKAYEDLNDTLAAVPTTMVLSERTTPRETHILIKGDFTRPADEVAPGTPSVLHPFEVSTAEPNRLDLARWLVDPRNPLTARVIVNRLWQQYFGRGLVSTDNDFGLVGERPTHPELLDWLASEFVDCGWSLKAMHRLIVTSHTYRQSSRKPNESTQAATIDPDNHLLARQNRLRLDAEIVRDVALRASGLLSTKMGGPPVYPPIPEGAMSLGQVRRAWKVSDGEDRYRRGLYTFLYRATPPPSLIVFDAPDGFSACTRRNRSNTPLQSLTLMNDAAFFECATALEKIIAEQGLETAFRRCTGRRPDAKELEVLERLDALTAARTMLNLDETITRE